MSPFVAALPISRAPRPPLACCLASAPRYRSMSARCFTVAIGIPEVDAVGELHRYRPSLRGIRTDVPLYSTVRLLSRYLLSVPKIKLGKASRHCAEVPQPNPSAALDSEFFRSDRRRFDRAPKLLTPVAQTNLHAETDQTLPACFGL
jgi:hypothetical protein